MSIHKEGYATIAIVVVFVIIVNILVFKFLADYAWLAWLLQLGSVVLLFLVLQVFPQPRSQCR